MSPTLEKVAAAPQEYSYVIIPKRSDRGDLRQKGIEVNS